MSPNPESPQSDAQTDLDDQQCAEAVRTCACFNFRKASRAVTQLFDETLAPTGLRSTQFVILVAIHVHAPIALADLARAMIADRTTLSRNLKPLEREELIARHRAPRRRAHLMRLTEAGEQRLAQAMPLWKKAQQQFVEQMGEANWDMMLGKLDEAVEAVEATRHR